MGHTAEAIHRPANHNLPYQLTTFVGRSVELAELKRLLRERRLVTLTGTGGSGKTRLALETAAVVAAEFRDGAFLVDLAALTRPELVAETAARVMGVEAAPARPLLETLVRNLRQRQVLLVLDNCEHLLDECARLTAALLAGCPDLRVLATSREPLGVGGESTFRVPLLSFPDPDSLPGLEELAQFEAIQLFLDRAGLADPGFTLAAGNAAAVAQVCARLDGIPLALELAAAALRAVSVHELASRLDQRFLLLTAGGRTVLPRHKTLGAMLDWSYTLLDQREQAVFRRLAAFPGDWTLDAAEFICAAGNSAENSAESPAAGALDDILRLVNKSLVHMDQGSGRYRLLETMRLYAREKLVESGEHEKVAHRHFAWYLGFVEDGSVRAGGPTQRQWFLRLEREQANLRAALDWAVEAGRAEEAARLSLALLSFWSARAYHREAECWLAQILASPAGAALPARLRARLLGARGAMAHTLNDFEQANHYLTEALRIWQELGDLTATAMALTDLAWERFEEMDLSAARRYAEESLALAREAGDPATLAMALQNLATPLAEAGEIAAVVPLLEECLGIWRALGRLPEISRALVMLARVEQKRENLERAARFMLEGLQIFATLGDYGNLIDYLVLMNCFEFDTDRSVRQPAVAGGYEPMAYLAHGKLLHGPAQAARLLGVMAAWQDRIIGGTAVQWDTMVVPVCDKLKAAMGEAEFEREFSKGRAMSVDDILSFAQEYARSVLALMRRSGPDQAEPKALEPRAAAVRLAPSLVGRGPEHPFELTPRETEVLRLVAAGLTNKQAAEQLVVTPRTINAHLTSIYSKTGITSRAAAVRFALEHGLA